VTKIVFTREATIELLEQAQYIYRQSLDIEKADAYLERMKSFIKETLGSFPKAGRPAEEFGKGVRKLVYQRYSILYRLDDRQITILAIYRENQPKI
jgi:plasmid stabilization system protein ParE